MEGIDDDEILKLRANIIQLPFVLYQKWYRLYGAQDQEDSLQLLAQIEPKQFPKPTDLTDCKRKEVIHNESMQKG